MRGRRKLRIELAIAPAHSMAMIHEAIIDAPWRNSAPPTSTPHLSIRAQDGAIVSLRWSNAPLKEPTTPLLREAERQLREYFNRTRTIFDLPLSLAGPEASSRVWQALYRIPYGATRRYGDLAHDLGLPAQQIGQACGANPIVILIPCHRVVMREGARGAPRWGGYSGGDGVDTKMRLLALEGAVLDLLS